MDANLKRRPDETVNQYIWRLASAKDNGVIDYSWKQLADVFNSEIGETNQTESSYRKAYQYAKKFYEDVFSNTESSEEVRKLNEAKQDLYREKIRVRDERNALNAVLRSQARTEENFSIMKEMIERNGQRMFSPAKVLTKKENNSKAVLCCLADLHYGISFDNFIGQYNPQIAKRRLEEYCAKIIKIGKDNNCDTCYVTVLGDCISGNIHKNIRVENRMNVLQQIMECSELITEFIYTLTNQYSHIYVNSVSGNHTRIEDKDDAVKDERLDNIILWYAQSALQHIDGVYIDIYNNVDSTIAVFDILGKKYVSVHGDYDSLTEKGVHSLCQFLGANPDYILYGHMHHVEMNYFGDVCAIRCGCLSGAGDNYTFEKRLKGNAYQVACVCNANGVESMYPVRLD